MSPADAPASGSVDSIRVCTNVRLDPEGCQGSTLSLSGCHPVDAEQKVRVTVAQCVVASRTWTILHRAEQSPPGESGAVARFRLVISEAETCRLYRSGRSADLAKNRAGLRTCPND